MASGLGLKVLGHDPFVSPGVAEELSIELVADLAEGAARSDFLSVHVPLSKETRGMIGKAAFSRARKGLRLVNCARGGVVDEAALIEALDAGTVAGAAFDVFEKEPPGLTPLVEHPKVVVTPHLGASTREAQENVALAACAQMVDYFRSGKLTNPVNAVSIPPEVQEGFLPYRELVYRLGLLSAQLLEGNPDRVKVHFFGDIFAPKIRSYLTSIALCGFLKNRSTQPVNAINAQHIAREMGLAVEEVGEGKSRYFHNLIRFSVETSGGRRSLGGTIRGQKGPAGGLPGRLPVRRDPRGQAAPRRERGPPGHDRPPGERPRLPQDQHLEHVPRPRQDRRHRHRPDEPGRPGPAPALDDLRSRDGILWAKVVELPE
jgi:D-3-phosphoglycerate dehydrogenase